MKKVLKLYGSAGCRPCAALKPIIQDIVSGRPDLLYQYVDVDLNPTDAQAKGIRSVPVVIVENDGHEVHRSVGVQTRAFYEQVLRNI